MNMAAKSSRFMFGAVAALSATAPLTSASTPTHSVEAIAVHGQAAPGTGPGVTFRTPTQGFIDSSGAVMFYSRLSGDSLGEGNNEGLWRGTPGNLSLIALEATAAPGTVPGVTFSGNSNIIPAFNRHSVAAGGSACFLGRLTGPGVDSSNDWGIWSVVGGSPAFMAREFDLVPGLTGVRISSIGDNQITQPINSAGLSMFSAVLSGTGVTLSNNQALFAGAPGDVDIVLRKGDIEPGTSGTWLGWSTSGTANDQGFLNDSGSFALAAFTQIGSQSRWGIWLGTIGTPTTFSLVANTGDSAAGVPDAVYENAFFEPSIGSTGRVGFVGAVSGPGVTPSNDRCLWAGTPGTLELIAREGGTWIDIPVNETFGPGFYTPTHLSDGSTLFRGSITGPDVLGSNNTGLWLADETGLRLVIREGQQIPGESPGTVVGDLAFDGNNALFANAVGQVVFETNGRILVLDPNHGLFSVLRPGDMVEVAPGDVRTLTSFAFIDNGAPILNEAGQFVAGVNLGSNQFAVLRVSIAAPPSPPCADANGDNMVDSADLSVLLAQFGKSVASGTGADFNGDGAVNGADLSVLLSAFGSPC